MNRRRRLTVKYEDESPAKVLFVSDSLKCVLEESTDARTIFRPSRPYFLKSLHAGAFRKCVSVWHYTYNTHQVYDNLPVSDRSQCNPYASAGVIDVNANVR
jgi:hypothetical protein